MTDTEGKRKSAIIAELDPHDDVDIDDDMNDDEDEESTPYGKPRDSGAIDTKGYLTNFELGEE